MESSRKRSCDSDFPEKARKAKKLKKDKRSKKKRRKHSSPSNSSSENDDLNSSDSERLRKKHKKKSKKKRKHEKKEKRKKMKKSKHSEESMKNTEPVITEEQKDPEIEMGPSVEDARKAMAPMTKEEWEKQQSVIRRVYDPETGRNRLIKGDGEILEEIVSKERHKEINKTATIKDGEHFQKKAGLLK